MKLFSKYYNGAENIIPSALLNLSFSCLQNIEFSPRNGKYTEKILDIFRDKGWSKNISISADSKAKINGIKENVGLVVFFGNHYYCYHQTFPEQFDSGL